MPKTTVLSACLLASESLVEIAASASGGAPDRVLLMRYGANKMRDGRAPVTLRDAAHAGEVIAATQAFLGGARFNFDYDHNGMKVRDPKVVGEARASGWATGFEADANGIWATGVEWTAAAAEAIVGREYRYISPLFMVARSAERPVMRFTNASLTNLPALDLEPLAASLSDDDSTEEEDTMSLKAIAASLGLAEDADEAAILAAIEARKSTMTAVAAALSVAEDGDVVAAAQSAVAAGEPDPKAYIPVAAHQAALDDVSAKLEPLLAERRTRLVEDAVAAGQIVPAQKDWALSFVQKHGEEEFASYLKTAPAFTGGRTAPGGQPKDASGLTPEEVAACQMLGVSPDQFLEARKTETVA